MEALIFLFSAALASFSYAGAEATSGPYRPEWPSLVKHDRPQWLLDAKFGIYAHWGVYEVPAYKSEWYGKMMYDPATGAATTSTTRKHLALRTNSAIRISLRKCEIPRGKIRPARVGRVDP
jgi:alpha-L-fucosidase-like protein